MNYDYNNLKVYRKKYGYTQEQLAGLLDVSRQTVAKWESGETLPDIENIIALADLYDISIDSLVRNLVLLPNKDGTRHMFGVTHLNDKRQITIPQKCCDVFGIKAGDALLLLGDEDRGIGIVKISEITEE